MSRGERLAQLFAEAETLAGAARDAYLAEVRAEDGPLADELASLLAAEAASAGLLDESPWRAFDAEPPEHDAPLPNAVGPYRIVRQVGRGGMGRVFLAEQRTEDFHRSVALKLIDHPALDAETLRRFRDEVRILAALEHPGIARFLDGGRSPEGIWFLALEFVEGEDLLAHARRRDLSIDDRVRLFLAVLESVAFAHSRGVVHRDLKPSNILVASDGRPRLLDFGISKLVDAEAESETLATRTELRAFTPAYASPEQFRGERVTTAADVYSLGVLFYELLAGVRPFGEGVESRAELERAVLEREPEPPGSAARRSSASAFTPREGEGGQLAPRRIRLSRDLDAICLKALRKEPADRYPTATAFADDLRCYLDGRPVTARRGGRRYRAARFLRRHRAGIATVAASLVAAVALLVAVTTQRGAERAAPPPDPPPRPFPFSAGIAAPIEELERRFAQAPANVEAGAQLALALGRAGRAKEAGLVLTRLRQIPGKAQDPFTDYVDATLSAEAEQPQRALVLHTRALDNAVASGRGELVAQIRASRGRLLTTLGQRDAGRREMETARAAFVAAGDQASLARVLNDLSIEEMQDGNLDEAARMLEAALVATRAASPTNRGATFLRNLGLVDLARGRPDLAEPRLREALEVFRGLNRPARLSMALTAFAIAQDELGRPHEAREAFTEAVAVAREADEKSALTQALWALGEADLDGGRLAGIGAFADEIYEVAKAVASQIDLGIAEALRGKLAAVRGDTAAARRRLAEAHRLFADSGDVDFASEILLLLAHVEHEAGAPAEAARRAEAAVARLRGHGANGLVFEADALLARIDVEAGRPAEARRRLAGLGAAAERSPNVTLRLAFLGARAELLVAEGRLPEARRDLETAIALARASERTVEELRLRVSLADLDRRTGQSEQARATAVAAASEAAHLGLDGIAARARRVVGAGA